MELFRIRFINKIRPDTIEIRYRAVLEAHSSDTIFEGHQCFNRNYLDYTILKNGEVALRAITNIFFRRFRRILFWIKSVSNNPMIVIYCKFQPSSFF